MTMGALTPAVRVLERNIVVYRRTWRGTLFTTFLAPVLFLGAIGFGLGSFVDKGNPESLGGVAYLVFLAPGMLASQAMQTAAGESMYPVLASIVWMKTYTAMVATPISTNHIVLGHVMWLTIRLTLVAAVFVLAMVAFGASELLRGIAMVPVAVLTGLAFAMPITAYTATRRTDNAFPAITRFIVTPLFIFSGTFFPVSQLPAIVQPVAYLTPLWHGVSLARAIAVGKVDLGLAAINLAVLIGFTAVGIALSLVTFRRRLVQ
jgi:lipooligosaccharide transport system permease protein